MRRLHCVSVMLLACTIALAAQDKYNGPRPPKADVPYLMHADNLIELDVAQAREEQKKDDSLYIVSGAAATARTPVAEPIFLFQSDKISPDSLELYAMEVKNGNRQVVVAKKAKNSSKQHRLMVTKLEDKLYRIEVNEGLGLENGEYSISPQGTNDVFCFSVY
ncbi:MAG TPA: hypothetical protein VN428_13130 [Bryobacteraceae bacterium]|nr:hypothetical protein [Bryobacteraceae bacterium]